MQRLVIRRRKGQVYSGVVMPRVLKKLNESHDQSRRCRIVSEAGLTFEVQDYNFKFVVNIERHECDCKRWDLSGIPCRHAWTAINHMRMDGETFLSPNHTKAAYIRAYDMMIQPVPQHNFWPNGLTEDECSPPIVENKPGRPVVRRIRHPSEGGYKRPKAPSKVPISRQRRPPKCGKCGGKGHNMRSCKPSNSVGDEDNEDNEAVMSNVSNSFVYKFC